MAEEIIIAGHPFKDNPINAETIAKGLVGVMLINENGVTPIEVEEDDLYTNQYHVVEPRPETKAKWGDTHPGWTFVVEDADEITMNKIVDGNNIAV